MKYKLYNFVDDDLKIFKDHENYVDTFAGTQNLNQNWLKPLVESREALDYFNRKQYLKGIIDNNSRLIGYAVGVSPVVGCYKSIDKGISNLIKDVSIKINDGDPIFIYTSIVPNLDQRGIFIELLNEIISRAKNDSDYYQNAVMLVPHYNNHLLLRILIEKFDFWPYTEIKYIGRKYSIWNMSLLNKASK